MLFLFGHLLVPSRLGGHGTTVYKYLLSHSQDTTQLGFFSLVAHEFEEGWSEVAALTLRGFIYNKFCKG